MHRIWDVLRTVSKWSLFNRFVKCHTTYDKRLHPPCEGVFPASFSFIGPVE